MAARFRPKVAGAGVALVMLATLWLGPRSGSCTVAPLPASGGASPQDAAAGGLLAETVGLKLHHALLTGDRAQFAEQVALLTETLLAPCGLLSWRVEPMSGQPAPASASVDDLQAVRALLAGAERWGEPAWAELAHRIADAALRLETVDGVLVEGASWESGDVVASRIVETAYLDLATLSALAEREPRWSIVHGNALALLRAAETPQGLFSRRVTLDGEPLADAGDEINAIHVLYCAIHLAEVELGGERTLSFLAGQFGRDGQLEGRFRLADGAPIPGYEDAAVYALTARLALLLGQNEIARRLLIRMEELEPTPFDDVPFDNLQASIALIEERIARDIDSDKEN